MMPAKVPSKVLGVPVKNSMEIRYNVVDFFSP